MHMNIYNMQTVFLPTHTQLYIYIYILKIMQFKYGRLLLILISIN